MTGNVTVEQQLPGDMAMQMSYVTNNSNNLYNSGYPNAYNTPLPENAPFTAVSPGMGEVQLFYNQGLFHYNALQVQPAQDIALAWPAIPGKLHLVERHDRFGRGLERFRHQWSRQSEQPYLHQVRIRAGKL